LCYLVLTSASIHSVVQKVLLAHECTKVFINAVKNENRLRNLRKRHRSDIITLPLRASPRSLFAPRAVTAV
jgi:hypothetical protein